MPLRRDLGLAKQLARLGQPTDAAWWFLLTTFRVNARIRVKAGDSYIFVRTNTPDVRVALSCFTGEFDEVLNAVPHLKHALIVDAGGYIGTAAMVFAKAYPDATIITLEPSSENFAILKQNVATYPNIHAMNKALAPVPGTLTLRNRGTGAWGFTLVQKPDDQPASDIEVVECTTLHQIMADAGTSGIGILKMDIEGGEHDLLTRDVSWVAKTDAICIELHDRVVAGCTDLYEKATSGRRNSKMSGEKYLSVAVG